MKNQKSIYEKCVLFEVEIRHHESDLYIPVNELTRALVESYEFKGSVDTFENQIEGGVWYDIPFAFDPYLENVANKNI